MSFKMNFALVWNTRAGRNTNYNFSLSFVYPSVEMGSAFILR